MKRTYEDRRKAIEGKMLVELSDHYLTDRERLIIRLCSTVALREVVEETGRQRAEFIRDLEVISRQVDEAQEIGRIVSRAFRY